MIGLTKPGEVDPGLFPLPSESDESVDDPRPDPEEPRAERARERLPWLFGRRR